MDRAMAEGSEGNEDQTQDKTRELVPEAGSPATAPGKVAVSPGSLSDWPTMVARRIPEQIGRYRILRLLGVGGMGVVYLAEDPDLGRQVALKIPSLGPSDEGKVIDRFRREARSAAALRHPNICPVFDVGEVAGVPYLTMAYLEGRLLLDLIRERPLPPRPALEVVRKVALALEYAHRQGVIHRDLKPSNIMIDSEGEPIVMDFGLAKRTGDSQVTTTGQVVGTPAYIAPEQVGGQPEAVGPPSDVYSLGAILYYLVTRRLPFEGDLLTVASKIAHEMPRPPSTWRAELDPAIDALCMKAMQKDPRDRFRSMAELAEAASRCLAALDSTVDSAPRTVDFSAADQVSLPKEIKRPSLPAPPPAPMPPHDSRRTLLAVMAIAIVILVGGFLAGLYKPGARRELEAGVGLLRIHVDQPGAEISLDGQKVWISGPANDEPPEIQVTQGEHALTVKKAGFESQMRTVTIEPGQQATVDVHLQQARAAEPAVASLPPGPLSNQPARPAEEIPRADPPAKKGSEAPARASPSPATPASGDPLPGIVPAPVQLPGVRRWNLDSIVPRPAVHAVAWSPQGNRLACGSADGRVWIWDLDADRLAPMSDIAQGPVGSVTWSPDGRRLAGGSLADAVRIWSVGDGPVLAGVHRAGSVAWSPDGANLAIGGPDNEVTITDLAGASKVVIKGFHKVHSVAWQPPDGAILASGGWEHMIRLWARTGEAGPVLEGHEGAVQCVTWSPDGKRLASASADKTIRLWNAEGKQIAVLSGHEEAVSSVAWQPDGERLASASWDRTVRVWQVTGESRETLAGHADRVFAVAWSPQGERLVSAGADGTLRIWRSGRTERLALLLDAGCSAVVAANGQLVAPEQAAIADRLVYTVESTTGKVDLLTPARFQRNFGQSFAPESNERSPRPKD